MDITEIITYLEDNGLEEVEEIKNVGDAIIIKFYYDFDNDELSAARSYSNDESDFEEESDEWYSECYIPYLKDIAVDNVEGICEEVMDEYEVGFKYKELGMQRGSGEFFEFIAAFSDTLEDTELEDILNEYCD
ncbi:MAG: hypothetical protein E7208_03990 [Clostridium butyricum]|nr:hypothetical protein [Clostridium butyricum]